MIRAPRKAAPSLVEILLESAEEAPAAAPRARHVSRDCLAGIVLEGRRGERARVRTTAVAVILLAHVGLVLTVRGFATRPRDVATSVPRSLRIEHVVALDPPHSIAPRPEPRPAPASHAPPRTKGAPSPPVARVPAAAESAIPKTTTAPAVAGAIVAAEPQAEPEIDFSADAVVTGPAENYGGGDTASSGSRHGATSGAATEGASSSGEGQGDRHPSHARAVGLSDAGWTCPRPEDARDVPSEDETVVLTVVVHPDGRVLSAALVSDPGHGLGERALACARAQRFAPATDDAGRPILATSPQIRVRFTR